MNRAQKISFALTLAFLVLFGALHVKLVSRTFFYDATGNIHTTFEAYGDVPFHMSMIAKFAFAPQVDLTETIFYGSTIHYHFIIEFLRGWILKATHDWTFSVLWLLYVLAVANIFFIFYLFRKLLKKNSLAIAALLIFFLGSGFGAWSAFLQGKVPDILFLGASYPMQNLDFGPILFTAFMQQQAFFLGTFSFLVFLWLLWRTIETGKKSFLISAGIVFGLMPFIHAHSFIAAGAVLGVAALLNLTKTKRAVLSRLIIVGVIAAVLAVPQIYFIYNANDTITTHQPFTHFRLGWMVEPTIGSVQFPADANTDVQAASSAPHSPFSITYLEFLWINFGIIIPVFIVCAILFALWWRKADQNQREQSRPLAWFGLTSLGLFLLVELVRFQPWDFDDNKIIAYSLFFAAPFMVAVIARALANRKALRRIILTVIVILMIFSGAYEVISRLHIPGKDLPIIFSSDSQALADYVKQNIPYDELVLTGTSHLNPVASLAGRPVLEGYPGWLWTIGGIDYSKRDSEIRHFYTLPSVNDPLFSEYPVKYILVDGTTEHDYSVQPDVYDKIFSRAFAVGEYVLYRVK